MRESTASARQAPGVNVVGYLGSVLGVGEAARQVADALEAAGTRVDRVALHAGLSPDEPEAGASGPAKAPEQADQALNLICVTAEALPEVAGEAGPALFIGRRSIGFWWWEAGPFPERFAPAFEYLDEVWVGSRHVAEMIEPASPVPVVVQPLPVEVGAFEPRPRAKLGLPEGFLFLFVFDYNSVFERKNPLALVEAFTRAFDPGEGASLAIKCINSERDAANHERLLAAAAGHPDVHVVDRHVSRADKDAMIAGCDCYASLHRAEGFGITLAEALLLGKPVLATGYSGNLEFTSEENAYLVPHRLVPIGPGAEPYPEDGEWAEPDVAAAAELMRAVFEQPEQARERAERGREAVRRRHSPEAAGRAMAAALERVANSEEVPVSARGEIRTEQVANRIVAGPGGEDGGGMRGAIKRVLLRVLRPYSVHQRRVDNELLEAIRALDRRVAELAERLDELERRRS
jgi:glycosyltransferase involved in cell wall biosynthesis